MNKRFLKLLLVKLGIDLYLKSPDRDLLEGTILPWLASQPSSDRVLFVGCDWYTHGYRKWFKPDSYWTLDYDPDKALFGSRRLHITDSVARLSDHFKAGSLDLIICNGVFGWGLDKREDIEAAFAAVAQALRPGGLFLFGWNDVPEHRPVALADIQALSALRPHVIAPCGVSQLLTSSELRHTFSLFARP